MSEAIRIDALTWYRFSIPLTHPFRISAGEIRVKDGVLLKLQSGAYTGWGEASVDKIPFYAHETVGSVIDVFENALFPLVAGKEFADPDTFSESLDAYRGANFAKSALDAAVWDVFGQMREKPVADLLGGVRKSVECGPSIGIKAKPSDAVDAVAEALSAGWRRIKLKVKPGRDTEYLDAVRKEFPDITLMADANNAYSRADFDLLASWDKYHLLMLEQPLDESDIYFHSLLRKRMKTPICLDESIHTYQDALSMVALGAADILNVKICRVGGLSNARRIIRLCEENGIANWIGSRVASAVSEYPRLAAATLANCVYPTDCCAAQMYMSDDVTRSKPAIHDGCRLDVPQVPGFGIEIDPEKLRRFTVASGSVTA